MSLDVCLRGETKSGPTRAVIFVREDGETREISRAEWDARYPGREPITVETDDDLYSANITHNLNKMADAAGIYENLWRPDEIGVKYARELIDPLREGLRTLRSDPHKFKTMNPSNGWGSYDGLVRFVDQYLTACQASPDATIHVSR